MDDSSIEKQKIHQKYEPRGNFWDIYGCNSGNFICLDQEINRVGLFQVRDIWWKGVHESFYLHLF